MAYLQVRDWGTPCMAHSATVAVTPAAFRARTCDDFASPPDPWGPRHRPTHGALPPPPKSQVPPDPEGATTSRKAEMQKRVITPTDSRPHQRGDNQHHVTRTWSTEFYQTVIKRLGGKARREPVWLWDCGWNITRLPCPEFRQPGYYTPDLDWSRGNPFNFHQEYKAGCDRGFEDGLQKGGKATGKGKAEDGLQKGG